MGKTSAAVKNRYNAKNYSRFSVSLKKSEYEELERLRGDKSRPEFLRELVAVYKQSRGID